jgi:nucleotide-binding universal stress UspA family protein
MDTWSQAPTRAGAVLVAIDGSEGSPYLLIWAAAEAASRQTSLTIVHAYPRQPMCDPTTMPQWAPEHTRLRQQALSLLSVAEDFVHAIVPAVEVRLAMRSGTPARIISSEARRASLTVLGRGSAHKRSVTSRVIARSGSPVSVVGSTDARDPLPPANRVIAILLPGQDSSSVMAVLDVALTTARRHGWPVTVMADWSDVWQAGLAESILKMRAYLTGNVDLETQSLRSSSSPLPPAEALSAAMVVLVSPRRHRVETETRHALDRLLRSAGAATTYVPRS